MAAVVAYRTKMCYIIVKVEVIILMETGRLFDARRLATPLVIIAAGLSAAALSGCSAVDSVLRVDIPTECGTLEPSLEDGSMGEAQANCDTDSQDQVYTP